MDLFTLIFLLILIAILFGGYAISPLVLLLLIVLLFIGVPHYRGRRGPPPY